MTRSKQNFDPEVDPHLQIIVQPTSHPIRFRYECEGRTAGCIPGANSQQKARTFPTIRLVNCTGTVVVVASCVSKSKPYRPHPNNLVGKDGCKFGVSSLKIDVTPSSNQFVYQHLGIQCVRKSDVEASLAVRKKRNVDPFLTGFEQSHHAPMDVVRICFQGFVQVEGPDGCMKNVPLPPVVSDPIYDKKSTADLQIVKTSEPVGPAEGGTEMIVLCERVVKEDITLRMFKKTRGQIVWFHKIDVRPQHVHRQAAISFRTPALPEDHIDDDPVEVMIELYRPSDESTSEPAPFWYLPYGTKRYNDRLMKRKHVNVDQSRELHDYLSAVPSNQHVVDAVSMGNIAHHRSQPYVLNIPNTTNTTDTKLPHSNEDNIAVNHQKRRVITPNHSMVQVHKEPKLMNTEQTNKAFDEVCLVDAIYNACSPKNYANNLQEPLDVLQPQPQSQPTNDDFVLIDLRETNNDFAKPSTNYVHPNNFTNNWNQLDGGTINSNFVGDQELMVPTTMQLLQQQPLQHQQHHQHRQQLQHQPQFLTNHHNQPNQQLFDNNYNNNQLQNTLELPTQPIYQTLSNVSNPNEQMLADNSCLYTYFQNNDPINTFTTTQSDDNQKYIEMLQSFANVPPEQNTVAGLPQLSLTANELQIQEALDMLGPLEASCTPVRVSDTETVENMTDSLNSLSILSDLSNSTII